MMNIIKLICLVPFSSMALRLDPLMHADNDVNASHEEWLTDLWMGADVDLDLFHTAYNESELEVLSGNKQTVTFVLGPIDSGTHLLFSFLEKNVPGFAGKCKPSTHGCRKLWKHAINKDYITQQLEKFGLDNVELVMLIRSPLSQIHSWKKDPWNMRKCVGRPYEQMGQPCEASLGGKDTEYDSTMAVFNKYAETYGGLLQDSRLKAVSLVTYEDVVLTPEDTMRHIGQQMNWEIADEIQVVEGSPKHIGGSHGRDAALAHLQDHSSYLSDMEGGQDVLCEKLDRTLIENLKEGTYTNEPKPYSIDCDK